MPREPIPFARASLAKLCFQAAKPEASRPHWAAEASPATKERARVTAATTAMRISPPGCRLFRPVEYNGADSSSQTRELDVLIPHESWFASPASQGIGPRHEAESSGEG